MANRTVSLYKKVKTEDGWGRYPVVIGPNGRLKTDTVIIGGEEHKLTGGHYELRHYDGTRTVWTRVKGGATDALAAWKTAQAKANAKAEAEAVGVKVIADDQRVSLAKARDRYIEAALARGAEESAEVYGRAIDDFLAVCGKRYADEIEQDDVVRWLASMRKAGKSARTISNRHGHLRSYLMYLGIDRNKVREVTGPKPRYDEPLPEIFDPTELKKFFSSLTEDYDKLLFDVLLSCGLREQEAMHIEWSDIDGQQQTLKVQSKPRWEFEVKDDEEREVPLQAPLLKRLQVYRRAHPEGNLIFGRRGGKIDVPDGHLLRRLKVLVRDAGLNCGRCASCHKLKECERWYLHKFRATYITTLLRNALDLRTVMKLSGHSDLASVERYIRPAEGKEVQTKVNAISFR